jgi:oxygen-dependent protoporphyrinogen oxidase
MIAARKTGAKRGHPLSFPDGLAELPRALTAALGPRLVSGRVTSIEPGPSGGWRLHVEGTPARREEAEAVVVATDAVSAARLLGDLVPKVGLLAQVPTSPVAVCALGFHDAPSPPLGMRLDGYGFLVARGEAPRLLGCQYESSTFAGRAPEGAALVRCILGGRGAGFDPDIVEERSDAEITRRAVSDLKQIAGLTREPDFARVWRHPNGIPQLGPGHLRLVAAIDEELAARPGLRLLGHTIRGVGVNESVRAATSVIRTLTSPS